MDPSYSKSQFPGCSRSATKLKKKRNKLQSQLGIYLDNKGLTSYKDHLENSDLTESAR